MPTQFEKVTKEEALKRNARQYPIRGPYGPQPQPVIIPAPVAQPNPPIMAPAYGQKCEQKCQYSYFTGRQICDWWCPRM